MTALFRTTGSLWEEPPVIDGFPSRRINVMLNVDIYFNVIPNGLFNTKWSYQWFETPCRLYGITVMHVECMHRHRQLLHTCNCRCVCYLDHVAHHKRPLQWRHNGRDAVSNHQPHDCFLNRLFRRRSKKTLKLCVTGLCEGNSPVTGEFPAQRASNAENVSIWWRHHA